MVPSKKGIIRSLVLASISFVPLQAITTSPALKTKLDLCAYIPQHNKQLQRNDAVEIAFKQRKDLEAFLYAEQASKYDERTALAGYLPQIQLGAQLGKTAPDPLLSKQGTIQRCPDSMTSKGLSFSISQLIINGGGPIIDYKIAQESTKIVQENMQLTQNNIQLNVETAFLTMQRLLLEKTFIESRDIASKALLAQSSGKNTVGFLNESSWLASTAQYISDQSSIANYARDVETALWTLQRQTASNITLDEISLSIDDATKICLKDLNFYLTKAFQYRPNLKIQDHMIRQAQLSEKKYRNSYVPSVGFFGQASDVKFGNDTTNATWSLGIEFGWQFDGLANVHQARKSDNQEIEYVLQKKDLEIQVKQDVESAYNQVKNNIDLLKASVAQFEQADAALKLKTKQFEVGTISRIDFAQAEQSYQSTRFQLDSTKLDTRLAYQNLLFACGYPKIDNHCI